MSLKTVHYMCMLCCAAGQSKAAPRRRTGQRPTEETKKDKETGKNNNLEDKGGRGDRLSPVGILNPCGLQFQGITREIRNFLKIIISE